MPTRLFRADTPHDVVCATIVAESLPAGRNLLAFSTDKTSSDPAPFGARLREVAQMHPWASIVDVSGLPITPRPGSNTALLSWSETARAIADSTRMLRRVLAEPLADRVDELYLTCLHHPDVQLMYDLFPSARKIAYPHGLDSVNATEIHLQTPFFAPRRGLSRWRRAAGDLARRAAWGRDALLPRDLRLDAAYSFNLPVPWAAAQHDLSPLLTRQTMRDVFARLAAPVRAYFEDLARGSGGPAALLLLPPFDHDRDALNDAQAAAVADFARRLVERVRPAALVVKPHPREDAARLESVLKRLFPSPPGIPLVIAREHHAYPIEVVLSPFDVSVCGAFGSGSLRTLRRIYGAKSYCPEKALLDLYKDEPSFLTTIRVWIEDNRREYTAI
ncbi:MAG TPA: hypothetical protein VNI01_02795 [Elusimicrobiota bacterium]|jgi:hypothetical protein|nr:hypothetical protein [Elusimicrobiota bacterium]